MHKLLRSVQQSARCTWVAVPVLARCRAVRCFGSSGDYGSKSSGDNDTLDDSLPDLSAYPNLVASAGQGVNANDIHLRLNQNKPKGVFREKESDDIQVLVNNFTAPALAEALRDREVTLQRAAALLFDNELSELKDLLSPFLESNVAKRREKKDGLDLSQGLGRQELVILQRYIHRMPRNVFQAAKKRASVVIPLCNVNGVASVLFERRSTKVRTHKQQVCFPGGMLDEGGDSTIIHTSLREMEEELGIAPESVEVLGILRCRWKEVSSMTGIAVTPVIGFIGELNELVLTPNLDEVEEFFTIPIEDLLDETKWLKRNYSTPVFTGGPHTIWGLTAYLLEKFLQEVVVKCARAAPSTTHVRSAPDLRHDHALSDRTESGR
jgi:nudix motif 8